MIKLPKPFGKLMLSLTALLRNKWLTVFSGYRPGKALITSFGAVFAVFGALVMWIAVTEPPPAAGYSKQAASTMPATDQSGTDLAIAPPPQPYAVAAPEQPIPLAEPTETGDITPPAAPATPPASGTQTITKLSDPGLLMESDQGPVPVIAPDGRMAWQSYARPFTPSEPGRPRIAILVCGLGVSESATQRALETLPAGVTLCFSPYGQKLQDWAAQARAKGHELLLQIPMEPYNYPANDPGPYTLLAEAEVGENLTRLNWFLSRFTGYVGITNDMGSKFTSISEAISPVLQVALDHGLMFMDSRSSQYSVAVSLAQTMTLPWALNNRFVDNRLVTAAINQRLAELEEIAKRVGGAVGVGRPYPLTIERITLWAETLDERGIDLAPVTALVGLQTLP